MKDPKKPQQTATPPDIYDYTDFQQYLKAIYTFKKHLDPNYSFRRFSSTAGLNSPNYLKLVMDGERPLTVANIHRFSRALLLGLNETAYFESLVLMKQSETRGERAYYQSRSAELRKVRRTKSVRAASGTALLEDPATTAVVVCVDDVPTDNAAIQIAKKSGVDSKKIELILETLKREKLIDVIEGKYVLSDRYIQFQDRQSKSANQKRYIRAQLENSVRALDTRYARDAKFFCNTFTIEADALETLQERIAEWIDELMQQTNTQKPERVVQLNLQIF